LLWDVGARIARPLSDGYTCPLSDIGKTIKTAIESIPQFYKNIAIDKYVIMPNHVHMIIVLHSDDDGRAMRAPTDPQ